MSEALPRIEPSALAYNPFQIAALPLPYPAYRDLRERAPVLGVPSCLGRDWILSRYLDVQQLLSGSGCRADDLPQRLLESAQKARHDDDTAAFCSQLAHWLFFVDGADHRRLQQALGRRFSQAGVESLRGIVLERAQSLLTSLDGAAEVELMAHFARLLPAAVSCALLGLPQQQLEQRALSGQALFAIFNQPSSLPSLRALARRARPLLQELEAHLRDPAQRDDVASDLAAQVHTGALAMREAVALAVMILSVGQDTTQFLIGNALHALLTHPEERERFCVNLQRRPRYLKELARFETPVQMIVHVAARDIVLREHRIRAGDRVHFCLGAANRDPAHFVNADALDLERPELSRLIFGAGPHFCLGAHLAVLIAEVALGALFERYPRLRLANSPPTWIKSLHMRGPSTLPVALT